MIKRKIISLCLIFSVMVGTLAACSKTGSTSPELSDSNPEAAEAEGGQGSQGKGRFIENDVALPENIQEVCTLQKLADGSLEVIGKSEESQTYYILKSSDLGESWDSVEVQGLSESYYQQVAIAPDGSVAFIPYTSQGISHISVADASGQVTETEVEMPKGNDDSENHIYCAEFDGEGNLIARDLFRSLLKIDLSTGTYTEPFDLQGAGINYFGIAGTTCLAVHDKGIFIYDTRTGEQKDSSSVLDDLINKESGLSSANTDAGLPLAFAAGEDENSVMYVYNKGIFYLTQGGNVAEQLVDSSLVSIGSTDIFYGAVMMDKEHLFISAPVDGGKKLLRYAYDASASATPNQELTVYALDESEVLRQVVASFQKSHPDAYVNLQIGMSGEDGVTLEDALSVLNTDIMAKKGPDVLILDGLPVDSYIEKGVLEDISDVVEEVEQSDGLFSNIKEASKQDGHIYAMPARFLIPLVEGEENIVTAGADIKTLADEAEKLKAADSSLEVMPYKGAKGILRELYYADSATWTKEDGTLDESALKNYYEQAKRLYDVNQYEETESRGVFYGETETFEGTKVGTIDMTRGLLDKPKIALGTMADMYSYQGMKSTLAKSGTSYCLLNHNKGNFYVPYLQAGVTVKENTDLAKEFVKALLGKKGATDYNGFPVNKAGFEEQAEKSKQETQMSIGFSGPDGEQVDLEYIPLTDQDISDLTEMIESLEAPCLMDRTIRNLILEQGSRYLSGEQSLEDAVSAALQKVNLYLAE